MERDVLGTVGIAVIAMLAAAANMAGATSEKSGANAPAPNSASIEETVIGPSLPGVLFSLSPHGVHAAMATTSGSRAVLIYDNVPGPKFDEIFSNGSSPVTYSDDGTRYAYCGRVGNEWIAMVDGKEAVRSSETNGNRYSWQSCQISFSPNNKHFYVIGQSETNFSRLYFDGKPICQGISVTPLFSPDGDHYAVYSSDSRGEHAVLLIDGRPAGYFGQNPQWSADSKHLYVTNTATTTEILLDGKSFIKAERATLVVPPAGNMVVAILTRTTNGPRVSFLVIGGKKIEGSEADMIQSVTISPDGKHYAARCSAQGKTWVFWDGKKGQLYDSLPNDDSIKFTADSSLVVYNPLTSGKEFLVMGEQESDGFPGGAAIVRSPTGHRAGTVYNVNTNNFVVIDTKTYPVGAGPGQGGSFLSFSPDATHFVYVANHMVFVDGRPMQAAQVLPNIYVPNEIPYVFSPDSKHIAFGAIHPSANGSTNNGVYLDGKFVPMNMITGRGFYQMNFTQDSKHLYWMIDGKVLNGKAMTDLFLDGQFMVEVANPGSAFLFGRGGFDLLPDGSALMLRQDEKGLTRVHITPSANTSSDTILTTGIHTKP
jgi:WD40 repeat protein